MSLKLFIIGFSVSLLMLPPVHAESGELMAGPHGAPGSMEERIRAYREGFEQRESQREQRPAQNEQRMEASRKRQEAMQKYSNQQMQKRMTMLAERQQQLASRHEAMRDRAQDRYNYLTRNSEAMINKMLDEQLDIANNHEELRKQAEARHRRIAAHRDAMLDMTPKERRVYLEEHGSEIFGPPANNPRSSAVSPPPWMMQRPPYNAGGRIPPQTGPNIGATAQ